MMADICGKIPADAKEKEISIKYTKKYRKSALLFVFLENSK
jgi:hypothetical protein